MITKKAFEDLLNQKYGYMVDKRGILKGASKRLYGTYFRTADREVFNIWYKKYLETGEL